ncbi:MAG: SIS domain-containing protein [Chloroflexota bacterium]
MTDRFLAEILEQPEALRRTIKNYPLTQSNLFQLPQTIKAGHYRQILLTGMGSSLHSCYPLLLALNAHLSLPVIMWDASELLHYAPTIIDDQTLLIAVSQSGESAEVKALADLAFQPGLSISVTNGLDNSLARWATINLDTHAGDEASVSTKTYVTTLAVLALLAEQLIEGDIPATQDKLYQAASDMDGFLANWESTLDKMAEFLGKCDNLAYIGRGTSVATARTSALITEESSKVFCMGLSAGQFRHGPLELARSGFKAVIFAGNDTTRSLNERLATDIATYGGQSLVVTPYATTTKALPNMLEIPISMAKPAILPILEIVPTELLTIRLAQANGFEPATFDHATKVTTEE